jgi:hypothetical protein
MEKITIEVIKGKIPKRTADVTQAAQIRGTARKPEGEVNGRAWVSVYVQCPYCGAINLVHENTDDLVPPSCPNCANLFLP